MDNQPENIFSKIKNDLTEYIEVKFAYFKLSSYEGIAKLVSILSFQLVRILLALFFFLFIFLSLGFFLGEILNSNALGFFIVAGIYALVIGLMVYFQKDIQQKIKNGMISTLMNINEEGSNPQSTINKNEDDEERT